MSTVSEGHRTEHRMTRYRVVRTTMRIVIYCWVAIMLFVALAPLWWMVRSAFSPNGDLYTPVLHLVPPGWPPRSWPPYLDLTQFRCAFSIGTNFKCHRFNFLLNIRNSTIVASATTIATVVFSTLAAYSVARLRYPGRATLARSVLFVYLVPQALLFIPFFEIMSSVHLLNTYWVLIVTYLSFSMPFCTWMLIGYLKGVPIEIEEAALIDGCSRIRALFSVVLPMAAPGVVAAALFTFTLSWNEFLYALILVSKADYITMPVALAATVHEDIYLYGQMMAGSVAYFLPVVILYLLGQRFIVGGLAAGAVKA